VDYGTSSRWEIRRSLHVEWDVYVVKGIDDSLEHLTWRRIAGGMFQTLGLKIIDGNIYVHGRDQITILHDLNGDGESRLLRNFNKRRSPSPITFMNLIDLSR